MAQSAAVLQSCCRARSELANQFAIAARLYAEAVVMLTRLSQERDFSRIRQSAAAAQRRCEDARVAFEEHIDSHHCSL
jgi:hypothetical protein